MRMANASFVTIYAIDYESRIAAAEKTNEDLRKEIALLTSVKADETAESGKKENDKLEGLESDLTKMKRHESDLIKGKRGILFYPLINGPM